MRPFLIACALLGASVLVAPSSAVRADDGPGDDDARKTARPLHDVRVRLSRPRTTPGGLRVRLTVANRGRSVERGLDLAIWSDADPDSPVWTGSVDLRPGRRRRFVLVLPVPAGTTTLRATSELAADADDGNPGDNVHEVPVGPGAVTPPNVVGAAIFLSSCSSCHGATGTGGTVDEDISQAPAEEVYEATQEGEEEMPAFPGITWQDANAIAAYLRDPVLPPPTPDPDPGTGGTTAPTYSGWTAAFLSSNCVVCHAGTTPSGAVRLDTYVAAANNASKALAAMQAGRMPPAGPVSADALATFADWIAAGTPK